MIYQQASCVLTLTAVGLTCVAVYAGRTLRLHAILRHQQGDRAIQVGGRAAGLTPPAACIVQGDAFLVLHAVGAAAASMQETTAPLQARWGDHVRVGLIRVFVCPCHLVCRFWKTGFWKQHLGDKPYHISALYLIDLVRFR